MNNFSEVYDYLPDSIQSLIEFLPEDIRRNTYEIRVRINKPLILIGKYGVLFIKKDNSYSGIDYNGAYCVSEDEVNRIVSSVCKYSVYSHQNDIINGFVTFGKGNRAGFCGNAVTENGKIIMLNEISGINIRIASDNHELSYEIKNLLTSFRGILIAGPPCSGKTTVLKKISEILSSEYNFSFSKTVVVDERYEMQGIKGINCDVLGGYPKAVGIEHAVRTLSPDTIICDEISSCEELEKMADGISCGVRFIASMHLSSVDDIKKSTLLRKILSMNIFEYVVLLKNGADVGKVEKIIRAEEINDDNFLYNNHSRSVGFCGLQDNSQRN